MRRFGLTAAGLATLTVASFGVTSAPAASAATSHGCPSGDVCIYPSGSWNGDKPSFKYYTYGAHNLSNQLGTHRVFNNQTGGATLQLCTAYNGGGCGTAHKPGWYGDVNLAPTNSIKLSPYVAPSTSSWGVDTTETITQAHVNAIKSRAGATPTVWGRYVSDCLPAYCGGNMTSGGLSVAKSNGIRVSLISADLESDTTASVGTADGQRAVKDAKANTKAPAGTLIVKDIEGTTTSAFLSAWYTAVKKAGYLPGFYLNPTHADVTKAFCGAQKTAGFSSAIIDSYEPEPSGATVGPKGAPSLSRADHFSCAGGKYDVYQYSQAQNIGTNFDQDVADPKTPGLLG
ncbi:glycoside hydrolase domain-containing protein [Flexivirga caeni]|uniref:glycoside hydrolase domain-containing protein n=1 Tax=Flexivirga caeni TaxID=2294115 RepID=UPI00131528DE|nr:glycoside hydrolase domain-containing protein [Flexivirga caeni]